MTEHLRPCPFCGREVEPEDMGEAIVICCACDLTPCAARATTGAAAESWNTRALGPALDVVLEAVEAMSDEQWRALLGSMHQDFMDNPVLRQETIEEGCRNGTARLLLALRDAHSPTDTPSGSEEEK